MGSDRTNAAERLLIWLGLSGAARSGFALAISVLVSIISSEVLAAPASRIFYLVKPSVVFFFAICAGLLLGLIAYYAAPFWDRTVFARLYGPRGRWRDATAPVAGLFPSGAEVHRARALLVQSVEPRGDGPDAVDREAVKIARRQAERWEKIERPLFLADSIRACLWPCVFAAALGVVGAVLSAGFQAGGTGRFLGIAVVSALACGLLLGPYCRFRIEYLLRLYLDVAEHAPKKKQGPAQRSELGAPKPRRSTAAPRS